MFYGSQSFGDGEACSGYFLEGGPLSSLSPVILYRKSLICGLFEELLGRISLTETAQKTALEMVIEEPCVILHPCFHVLLVVVICGLMYNT